jgi:hypothetical protein
VDRHLRGLAFATIGAERRHFGDLRLDKRKAATMAALTLPEMIAQQQTEPCHRGGRRGGSPGQPHPASVIFIVYGILTEHPSASSLSRALSCICSHSSHRRDTHWTRHTPELGPRGPKTTFR